MSTPLRATALVLAILPALAAPAVADTILLKNGSRVSGKIVESNDRQIVVKISELGRLTLKRGEIAQVVKAPVMPELPKVEEPKAGAKTDQPASSGSHASPAPKPDATQQPPDKPDTTPAKTEDTPPTPPDSPKPADLSALTGPQLIARLETADPKMTGTIINAVIQKKDKETLGQVLPLAKSEKASVRAAAAVLLGILGKSVDPEARIKRESYLETRDKKKEGPETGAKKKPEAPDVEIDDRAVAALRRLAVDPDASVRAAAVSGLASLNDAGSMELIVGRLVDRAAPVRDRAQAALLDLLPRAKERDRVRLPRYLVDLLRSSDKAETIASVLETVGRLGEKTPLENDRLIDTVTGYFRHNKETVRAQAFIAIGRIAPKQSLRILTERLQAKDEPWVRIQIMTAMALSGNKQAIPPLIEILDTEKEPQQIKDAAVRSLQQLSRQFFGSDPEKWRAWWARVGGQQTAPPPAEKPHTAPKTGPAPKH